MRQGGPKPMPKMPFFCFFFTDPGRDVALLRGLGLGTRVFGDVEPRDADLTGGLGDRHHVVENLGRLLDVVAGAAAAAGLEADTVDAAVHLRGTEDLVDLVGDREVERHVDGLAAERPGLGTWMSHAWMGPTIGAQSPISIY